MATSSNPNLEVGDEKAVFDHVDHVETASDEKNVTWDQVRVEAERDEEWQHSLTLFQSLKVYRHAAAWSVAASFCIIMESYDTLLLGSLFALPAFKEHFGDYNEKTGYQIAAPWQAGTQQGANIGSFFGIIMGAVMVDHLGYKRTILANLVLICPFIGLVTFAPNIGGLLAGEILCGLPWGVFSTLAEAYASEVCPLSLRGYLTTFVNLCWVTGHLIGAGILRQAANMTGTWSYRMPFAVQWVWPIPIFCVLLWAPESPWWLVRKGKIEKAERSAARLAPAQEQDRVKDAVSAMIRTNELEKDVSVGTRWIDCFKGTDLRRTEISMVTWTCQIMCGLQFANYSTYFFNQAGLATVNAFNMTMGLYAAAFIGTCSSWILLHRFGRRSIFTIGLFLLACGQILIGILSVVADHGNNGARWAQAGMMIVWLFTYDLTVGPLAYVIVGETSSTRLRNKTVGLSRMSYNVFSVGFGVLMPYMLNPNYFNWQGKVGFFWGPICFLCWLWAYFRLPEMKGRSYYELDVLFQRKVPARKFKTTEVEPYADEAQREAMGISGH